MSARPSTTKAAILAGLHEPLVVDEISLPERLDAGQVLVHVTHSGICGSQLGEIDGLKGPDRFLPHLLGHEGSGTVIETGPGVRHVRRGDHVVLHWRPGAGIDADKPSYVWKGRPLNAGSVTTFNEHAVVSENRVTSIPADVDPGIAALFGCPVTTGLGVVCNDAGLTIGESIVVLGAGGVGLSIVQGAAMVSAYPVVAVDRFETKLALAKRLGASHTVDSTAGDLDGSIRALVGRHGADVVVDNTGDPDMIRLACDLTRASGRTILVGVPPSDRPAAIPTLPLHFGRKLAGSHGGGARPERDIPRYLDLYKAGKLALDDMITNRFKLDEINDAIALMRAGEVSGRCLIETGPGT